MAPAPMEVGWCKRVRLLRLLRVRKNIPGTVTAVILLPISPPIAGEDFGVGWDVSCTLHTVCSR